uniref:Uncharacterized protein LOC100372742 n=1 Tax=Saccoglossus kowalevskii TaxID=10224 RepID=A0ABM0MUT0_SACKO|nr:PREDICTED: uncharacterized protein LOC100372742 [Saccoglossus kowalevskii]
MDGVVYDLCIVGAGLIGSAAARHATIISPAAKICLIGPKEPKTVEEKHGRTIFGAHYDEGRITRTLDPNPIWGVLANRSIARYRDIEKRTGVKFFSEVGHMTICNKENEDVIRMKEIATDLHVNFDIMDHKDVNKQFTYLNIDTYDVALLQSKGAGHVSPRSQLLAQQTAAHLQGCNIIDDVIVHVTETNQLNGSVMKLTTEKGDILS